MRHWPRAWKISLVAAQNPDWDDPYETLSSACRETWMLWIPGPSPRESGHDEVRKGRLALSCGAASDEARVVTRCRTAGPDLRGHVPRRLELGQATGARVRR